MHIKNPTAHLAYVATLPCETLMSAKQTINDKLLGSVAACLRCGAVVINQIKKGLLLSLRVKKSKICVTSKNVIVSCTFFVFQQYVGQVYKDNAG